MAIIFDKEWDSLLTDLLFYLGHVHRAKHILVHESGYSKISNMFAYFCLLNSAFYYSYSKSNKSKVPKNSLKAKLEKS